jgi:hypothetical protein
MRKICCSLTNRGTGIQKKNEDFFFTAGPNNRFGKHEDDERKPLVGSIGLTVFPCMGHAMEFKQGEVVALANSFSMYVSLYIFCMSFRGRLYWVKEPGGEIRASQVRDPFCKNSGDRQCQKDSTLFADGFRVGRRRPTAGSRVEGIGGTYSGFTDG